MSNEINATLGPEHDSVAAYEGHLHDINQRLNEIGATLLAINDHFLVLSKRLWGAREEKGNLPSQGIPPGSPPGQIARINATIDMLAAAAESTRHFVEDLDRL